MTAAPLPNTVLVSLALVIAGALTWHGDIPGDAFIALVSAVVGALLHESGVSRGQNGNAPS